MFNCVSGARLYSPKALDEWDTARTDGRRCPGLGVLSSLSFSTHGAQFLGYWPARPSFSPQITCLSSLARKSPAHSISLAQLFVNNHDSCSGFTIGTTDFVLPAYQRLAETMGGLQ